MKNFFIILFVILIIGGATFGIAVWVDHSGSTANEIDLSRNALIHRPASPTPTPASPAPSPPSTQKIKLPNNVLSPAFSPYSNDVAYVYFDDETGQGNISVADSNFQSYKNLLKTRIKGWRIQWVNAHTLSLVATADSNNLDSLFLLDTKTSELTPVIQDKKDLRPLWSPDGTILLFSHRKGPLTELVWVKRADSTAGILPLEAPAFQCAWTAATTVSCTLDGKIYTFPLADARN